MARPEAPVPTLAARERPPVDVTRRRVALRQADAERAAEGPDQLDPAAPRALWLWLTSRCRLSGRPPSGWDAREGRMLRADGELLAGADGELLGLLS